MNLEFLQLIAFNFVRIFAPNQNIGYLSDIKIIVDKESRTIAKGIYQKKTYVLKILKQHFIEKSPNTAYLEVKISEILIHPNIISLINVFSEKNGNMVLVYEQGDETLSSINFYTLYGIKRAIRDILVGLLYMHGKGIMHNDIKLDNIVRVGKCYKIIDFGSARFFNPEKNYNFTFHERSIYSQVAPEVKENGKHDLKSDVFSVGFILEKLLNTFKGQNNDMPAEEKLKTEEFLRRLHASSPSSRFSAEEALYDSWFNDIKIKFIDLTEYKDCKNKKFNFSKEGNTLNITIDDNTKLKIQTEKYPNRKALFVNSIYLNEICVLPKHLPTYYIEAITNALSKLIRNKPE